MHNFIRMLLDHVSKEDKIYGGLCSIWGLITSFFLIDATTKWQFIIQGCRSVFWMALMLTISVVLKAMLKPAEPYISKWSETVIINIKSKFKKHGKNSNNKAA